jgi:hypothetical protein
VRPRRPPGAGRRASAPERRTAALLYLQRQVEAAGGLAAAGELLSRAVGELRAIIRHAGAGEVGMLARQIEACRSARLPL